VLLQDLVYQADGFLKDRATKRPPPTYESTLIPLSANGPDPNNARMVKQISQTAKIAAVPVACRFTMRFLKGFTRGARIYRRLSIYYGYFARAGGS
jgi:hypothetical protein